MIQAERIPLLRGEGRFVDDIRSRDMAHMAFVRSPHAHARITHLDTQRARAAPGVIAVLTAGDLGEQVKPIRAQLEAGPHHQYVASDWYPMARQCVRYVGEIVCVVIADDRYLAEDAAQWVEVDYEPLPVVSDVDAARADGTPLIHTEAKSNVLFHSRRATPIDGSNPMHDAPVRVRITVRHPRVAGLSIEGAGAFATFDAATSELELTTSTQIPHLIRDALSQCLNMPENLLRVLAPDVGGGFGPKAQLFPEEVLVAHAARVLSRPVKWVQDRSEHLAACFHARDARVEAELATDRDGIILGVRARVLCDVGAYSSFPFTCSLEAQTFAAGLTGPYRVPYFDYEGLAVATNKYPSGAYRGVGFPLCPLTMETLLDRVAQAIQVDPSEVRRRNMIRADELPWRNPAGALYDSGDYPRLLDMALDRVSYQQLREQQRHRSGDRFRLGIGISCCVEFSGMNRMVFRLRGMTHIPGFDSALVRVTRSGSVEAYVSTPSQGQSQRTTFARLLADVLQVSPESVRIVLGDTRVTPYGSGTFASRSLVSGGGALQIAAAKLRERLCTLAAMLWQVDVQSLSYSDATVHHRGEHHRQLTMAQLAEAVHSARHEFPDDFEPGLEARASYDPPGVPVSPATHIAVVEVDTYTGAVQFKRYVVAEDCGPVVDQEVVDGQVRGAIAQAIGCALYEEVRYDEQGQLMSGTLQDYIVPGIFDVPPIEIMHLQTPSPFTEGGYKGIAEGGTIAAPAAITNAVADAIGVLPNDVQLPLTPERVLAMLESSR